MNQVLAGSLHLLQSVAKPSVTMADQFRSDGRIYVVIAVMLTILLGITIYLVRLDKKITRLEKRP